MVAVDTAEGDFTVGGSMEFDVNETWFDRADTMLEGVFNQRDEYERCYLYVVVLGVVHIETHLYIVGQPYTHERRVGLEKLGLALYADEWYLVFVEHVAQQMAELLDGLLRALGVEGRERVDVVERIEKEVRIYLILDVL